MPAETPSERNFRITNNNAIDKHVGKRVRLRRTLLGLSQEQLGVELEQVSYPGVCAYHDSCSGLRELAIHQQPRALLQQVEGLSVRELDDGNACCGFGGLVSVKYPDLSGRIVSDKCGQIAQTEADTVLGGDLGCLLNIAGRLRREGSDLKVFHVAEVLAGMTDGPAIGEVEGET